MTHDIYAQIRRHIQAGHIPQTRFGRDVCGDPNLVKDIENGRRVGPKLARRISNHISLQSGNA